MPIKRIFLAVDGVAQGPFGADELSLLWRAGEIEPAAKYWYPGMMDWKDVTAFVMPTTEMIPPAVIELTTADRFVRREVERECAIISAECVLGLSWWNDLQMAVTDVAGGRSEAAQRAMRGARQSCLEELRKEAAMHGADGIFGVRITYSQISGQNKNMLLVAATGTAVWLGPPPLA
jgi:uncharacterized protein YbjQ (UPF0145 family)